jgi:hypothetical protein
MTPCSVPPPRQAAASWRLDLHPGCQDTRQRPWPASFTNRVLDRSSAFLWLPVGRLPAGSQLGRVVLKQLFLQPPTKRRTLAKAPESCPSPPSADGRQRGFAARPGSSQSAPDCCAGPTFAAAPPYLEGQVCGQSACGSPRPRADLDEWLLQHGPTRMPHRFAPMVVNG